MISIQTVAQIKKASRQHMHEVLLGDDVGSIHIGHGVASSARGGRNCRQSSIVGREYGWSRLRNASENSRCRWSGKAKLEAKPGVVCPFELITHVSPDWSNARRTEEPVPTWGPVSPSSAHKIEIVCGRGSIRPLNKTCHLVRRHQ